MATSYCEQFLQSLLMPVLEQSVRCISSPV
jgi:hypothetical protein